MSISWCNDMGGGGLSTSTKIAIRLYEVKEICRVSQRSWSRDVSRPRSMKLKYAYSGTARYVG